MFFMILGNRLPGKNLIFQFWPKIFPANQIAEEEINLFHFLHGDNHQRKVESEATFSCCLWKGINQSFIVFA